MVALNIIVLIKQVPDPNAFVGLKEDGTLDREKAAAVINPYDKNALEAALLLKQQQDAWITVISMGPPNAENALRNALAMGADDAYLLSDRKLGGCDTLATAYALSCAVRKVGNYDLILCGMEATDGNTAQVGPEIAERLGISQLTWVDQFTLDGDYVNARRMLEGGHEQVRAKLPVLLTITNTANTPRYPTFGGILKAEKQTVTPWTADDAEIDETKVGLVGSPTKIRKIDRAVSSRSKYTPEGCSVAETLDNLLIKLQDDGVQL